MLRLVVCRSAYMRLADIFLVIFLCCVALLRQLRISYDTILVKRYIFLIRTRTRTKIQTQMAQKPMLRAEVYAHAMRASQIRKKEVRREKVVLERTRTRTNTYPNGTEANAASRSVRACDARKSKS